MSAPHEHYESASTAVSEQEKVIKLPRAQSHVTFAGSSHPTIESHGATRLKACDACKQSKVRCRRDEQRPDDACERCIGVGRQCIVSARAKNKKPRRNVSTVASLESKVDALVAALKENQAGEAQDRRRGSVTSPLADPYTQGPHQIPHEGTRFQDDSNTAASASSATEQDHSTRRRTLPVEYQYSLAFFMPKVPEQAKDLLEDVIDQGLITMEEAEGCLSHFIDTMLPHFPVVAFPPEISSAAVRRSRPVLFLAILGAASSHLGEDIRTLLFEESMRVYANRLFITCDKNLDIVEALLVSSLWFLPPERFDEVKVYQLYHFAAIMATELEFGRAATSSRQKLFSPNDGGSGRSAEGPFRSTGPHMECQRAWLSCYIVCSIAAMVTRRPRFMRWSYSMDECVRALEKSSIVVSSDLYLCQLARAQRIAEEIGLQFPADDPSANVNICDLSTQYVLQACEQRINQWKEQIPPNILRPTFEFEASILNLYLFEIYLHSVPVVKGFEATFEGEGPLPASKVQHQQVDFARRRALAICIVSAKTILDTFLSFDTNKLCSIPLIYYVRTESTVFTMIEIYFAVRRLDGDLYEMVERDLNIEWYIDALLNSLQKLSQAGTRRVSAIFSLVLFMLRTWFRRQKSQNDQNLSQNRQNNSVFHTVLQTADALIANNNISGSNFEPGETTTANSSFPVDPTSDNTMPPATNSWPLEQDEDMVPWNDFDIESFFDTDEATLFQIALERMGGLIG